MNNRTTNERLRKMKTYTIKTDAGMYDIEAENDEQAIEIARNEI